MFIQKGVVNKWPLRIKTISKLSVNDGYCSHQALPYGRLDGEA